MTTKATPPATTPAQALQRLDLRILTAKTLRECFSIAARGHPKARREVPPHDVAAVIGELLAALDGTRATILRDGKLPD